ncbi:MAG TPA: molybdenum cofactor synthesis domain-containing protein [Thermoanaerobaculia bacterium]|nr:molybdenum cofactor synthesis domain-containing protein [Thermoanaerobaculia bacterium]
MDVPAEHRAHAPAALGFAALTVSDSRTAATDGGGRAIRDAAEGAGHRVVEARIVRDEVEAIRGAARALLSLPEVDVLVLTGGTGLAPRDVTLDAVAPLIERPVEGFGELFRMLSYRQVGAAAMLSRAAAGVVAGKAVFALPGSPQAVTLAMEELILPEAGHLVAQARRG